MVAAPMLRFARRQGADAARLPFRGTLAPGGALRSAQAPATPPPVWFVFPGACPSLQGHLDHVIKSCCPELNPLCNMLNV